MILKVRIYKACKNIDTGVSGEIELDTDTKCVLREILEPKQRNRRVIEDVTI